MKPRVIKKILKNLNAIHKAIEVITTLIPVDEEVAPKVKVAKKRGRKAKK